MGKKLLCDGKLAVRSDFDKDALLMSPREWSEVEREAKSELVGKLERELTGRGMGQCVGCSESKIRMESVERFETHRIEVVAMAACSHGMCVKDRYDMTKILDAPVTIDDLTVGERIKASSHVEDALRFTPPWEEVIRRKEAEEVKSVIEAGMKSTIGDKGVVYGGGGRGVSRIAEALKKTKDARMEAIKKDGYWTSEDIVKATAEKQTAFDEKLPAEKKNKEIDRGAEWGSW